MNASDVILGRSQRLKHALREQSRESTWSSRRWIRMMTGNWSEASSNSAMITRHGGNLTTRSRYHGEPGKESESQRPDQAITSLFVYWHDLESVERAHKNAAAFDTWRKSADTVPFFVEPRRGCISTTPPSNQTTRRSNPWLRSRRETLNK